MAGINDMILEAPRDDDARFVPPPVHGYRPLPKDSIDLVNIFKIDEEQALRHLDQLESRDDIDKRWLAIGRTRLQEAYMAIVRSIFQPTRLQI
jgi:hypothetical protein